MTAQFLMDQERGKKNIVSASNYKLGETGFVRDITRSGQNVYVNSGNLIEVMIVKATAALTAPAGKCVVFDDAAQGMTVGALAATIGDGIVDPDLSGNIAIGDTFLIFRKGPMNVILGGTIAAGAGIKLTTGGIFVTDGGSASAPLRCGRLMVAGDITDVRRAWVNFTNP